MSVAMLSHLRATSTALLFVLACKPSEEGPPTYDAIDGVHQAAALNF